MRVSCENQVFKCVNFLCVNLIIGNDSKYRLIMRQEFLFKLFSKVQVQMFYLLFLTKRLQIMLSTNIKNEVVDEFSLIGKNVEELRGKLEECLREKGGYGVSVRTLNDTSHVATKDLLNGQRGDTFLSKTSSPAVCVGLSKNASQLLAAYLNSLSYSDYLSECRDSYCHDTEYLGSDSMYDDWLESQITYVQIENIRSSEISDSDFEADDFSGSTYEFDQDTITPFSRIAL